MRPATPLAHRLPHGLIVDNKAGWVLLSTPRPWFMSPRLDVGCAWRITPRNVEVCSEATCLDIAQVHASLLRGLPVGTCLQVIMLHQPATSIPAWEALRPAKSPLVAAQLRHIRQGMPHGRGRERSGLYRVETYMTLRFPLQGVRLPHETLGRIFRFGSPAHRHAARQRLAQALAPSLSPLDGLRHNTEDLLRQAGHQVQMMTGEEIGQAVAQVLDPLASIPVIDDQEELRTQVLGREKVADGEGWHADGDGTAVLTMHRSAPHTYPGILVAPRAPEGAEPLALWDTWPGPLAVVVNVEAVDQGATLAGIRRRRFLAYRQRLKVFGGEDPENAEIEREFQATLKDVFTAMESLYNTTTHIVLYGPHTQLSRGVELVRSATRRLGMEFIWERSLGATLLLQALPLGFDAQWPPPAFLARARLLPGRNVSQLLPLYGGVQGNASPSIVYLNRRGEAVTWAPLHEGLAMHGLVDGKTGAGKSYAMAHLVNQMLPLGSRVVILDQLPSYREICDAHKGSYYEMDFNTPVCLNPFFGPLDREHQAFATAAIAEMASGDTPLSQEQLGVLSDAVGYFMAGWAPTIRGEPRLGLFDEAVLRTGVFSEQDRRARRIALEISRRLRMFTGNGHLAGFVDGVNTFRIERLLTVVELSKLSEFKQLQGIILFVTMHLLMQFFQAPDLLSTLKFFIGDESWAVLKNPATADVFERIVRTARKLLVSSWFLSQRGRDFDGPVGQVIAASTDIKLFFWQSPQEITQMRRIAELTDAEVALARKARRRGDWGSAFLRLPDEQGGLVHLVADRSTDWIVGQTVAHRDARNQAKTLDAAFAQGGPNERPEADRDPCGDQCGDLAADDAPGDDLGSGATPAAVAEDPAGGVVP